MPSGFADPAAYFNQQIELVGSLDGLYFSQDKLIVTSGRRADPRRADQIMVSEHTANRFVLHAGQVLTINLYNRQQVNDPRYNPLTMPPAHRARLTIAGIGVFTDEVVQDDVDRIDRLLATPAFTRQQLACCGDYTWVGLKLITGPRTPAVQRSTPG
jgi:hypothetical protein